nr:DUF1707 domain-containing protein [Propionibacterium sp.]
MSNLPISSKYVSTPGKPVDERERESVVARVNAAFEAGQLDDLDYRRYLDIAFRARTLGELRPVVERLPAVAPHATPGNIEPASVRPGELSEARQPGGRTIALLGGVVVAAIVLLVLLLAVLL